jgi:hypothetical protein
MRFSIAHIAQQRLTTRSRSNMTQYTVGFVFPLIAGALWDFSGVALLAFVPGVIGAGLMAWFALPLRIPTGQEGQRAT